MYLCKLVADICISTILLLTFTRENGKFEKYLLSDNILDVGNLSVGYYIVHIITITGLEVTNSFIISK
jgi:hypothetical protein